MDRRSSDALRGRTGLLGSAPRPVPAAAGERRASALPAAPVAHPDDVCPAEVEARLAVLLRWM